MTKYIKKQTLRKHFFFPEKSSGHLYTRIAI